MSGLFNFLQYSTYSMVFGSGSAALIYSPVERAKPSKGKPQKSIRVKLLEVGKDFDVKIRSYNYSPRYPTVRKLILPHRRIRTTAKRLREIYAELAKKFPKYVWKVDRVQVDDGIFYRIERKKEGEKSIPVYYSLVLGKVFVPSSYVRRHYRLTCSVISYRLRDLKASYRLTNV